LRIRSGSRPRAGCPNAAVCVAVLVGLGAPATAWAQTQLAEPPARPRNARPGLAASLGVGASYANLGAQLSYLHPLPGRRWTVYGGAGLGRWGGDDARLTLDGKPSTVWAGSFAVGASFGQRNRLCMDLGYGGMLTQAITIEGLIIDVVARYGVFAQVGYEFLGDSGLFLRLLPLGAGYVPHPLVESRHRLAWMGSVGAGYKLW
jgi:hypothetical protein